ncbi:MAG: DNA (cytosine-5-)-methyltransferase [Victivallales bacterium]|nr:DNA (cytosine-5-)-methyltransferase [Victivallales bacterium]
MKNDKTSSSKPSMKEHSVLDVEKLYTYLDAMKEIISCMEVHEAEPRYPYMKAAVTHFLQNPEVIPQGLPETGRKVVEEYRPKITFDFFRTVPFPPPKEYDFKFIDLFAGIGGFRLAFQANGGKCVFSSEWNEFAQKTYEANYGEIPYGDIKTIDKNAIPFFDVLCAGFPCQPFSLAGVSKKNSMGRAHGFADKAQGTLFFEIAEILRIKRPAAFMLENVKNLESHDKGKTFEIIRSTLEDELGYVVNWKIVDGSKWVPQHRERIFIVGYNPELIDITKEEIIIPSEPEPGYVRKELKDIIRNDVTDCTLGPGTWATLERHKRHHEEAGHGFGYGLHILPIKEGEITRTISARYSKDGAEILIEQPGNRPRHLSVDEAMQLQGYDPEKFIFPVSNTQAFKQIGNSVVWPAIRSCALQIAKVLKERRK